MKRTNLYKKHSSSQDDIIFTLCRLGLSGSPKTRMDILRYARSIGKNKMISLDLAKRLDELVAEKMRGDMKDEMLNAILRQEP